MGRRAAYRKKLRDRMSVETVEASMLIKGKASNASPFDRTENIAHSLQTVSLEEIKSTIASRLKSAEEATTIARAAIRESEYMYAGIFDDKTNNEDERIYIPKIRENIQMVGAHLLSLIADLPKLVDVSPAATSISNWGTDDDYRLAKIKDIFCNFYLDDVWKIRTEFFPNYIKTFLKSPLAVAKVSYSHLKNGPDVRLDVVDRGTIFIDPNASSLKNAEWVIEEYTLKKHEVLSRFEDKIWQREFNMEGEELPASLYDQLESNGYVSWTSVDEDVEIKCWDYWQAPTKGLPSVYAVIIGDCIEGGEIVRYGENPFPYKGIPFVGKSYDQSEWDPDGLSLAAQGKELQLVINTYFNYRLDDVSQNIIQHKLVPDGLITAEGLERMKKGDTLVPMDPEFSAKIINDPTFDLKRYVLNLVTGTTTDGLLAGDLPFVMGLLDRTTHSSDVMRGEAPAHQATLGQIEAQLSQNQGFFRPVYLQLMRLVEEVCEILNEYFKSEEFFNERRMVQVVGENRYSDVIQDWSHVGNNQYRRQVIFEEMDVDVQFNAVGGADALSKRRQTFSAMSELIAAIGQTPEMYKEFLRNLNMKKFVNQYINTSGLDIDGMLLSDEDIAKNEQAQAQSQQQALIQQQQFEQMKAQAKSEAQIAVANAQAQIDAQMKQLQAQLESQALAQKELLDMRKQLELKIMDFNADILRMGAETKFETSSAGKVQVGHGNEINKEAETGAQQSSAKVDKITNESLAQAGEITSDVANK